MSDVGDDGFQASSHKDNQQDQESAGSNDRSANFSDDDMGHESMHNQMSQESEDTNHRSVDSNDQGALLGKDQSGHPTQPNRNRLLPLQADHQGTVRSSSSQETRQLMRAR